MATTLTAELGRAFYGRFSELRPAQRESIEPVVAGRDVLVLAGTGSGKTEAVLAPLVQRWLPAMRREPRLFDHLCHTDARLGERPPAPYRTTNGIAGAARWSSAWRAE